MKQNSVKHEIRFKYNDGSKIYFTSDSHFGHPNIIEFCKRPFRDINEMNQTLIENWNRKVPEDAIVFHLGDFAFGGQPFWKEIRGQLNGKIILIKGNHDEKNLKKTCEEELFEYSTYQMKIEIEGRQIYLNHVPLMCYGGTYRDEKGLVYQLHGHIHLSKDNPTGKDIDRVIKLSFPTQYDVGVDLNGFTPMSWKEVNDKIQTQIQEGKNV